ncbi:MBL fold metallo-hydrolase [Acetobacter conturbans]|uniref:MBL fold metallo-hydrolase n=1 Tax=Acetobacter conturbans TaxID=1737472 RepID=A0ABX0K321_9PROT|nr:MBL fold metallo-hydrolase [Acetobacter conturbans]NHN88402.1 MBL fold metallo-hydrolase [Acetobacter conturbans]
MDKPQWHTVGEARIVKVPDMMLAALPPSRLLPDWNDDQAQQAGLWLADTLDAPQTHALLSVHSWLVEDRGRKILIDTGAGNDKARPAAPYFDHLHTTYLENLSQTGIQPEEIDFVLLTHLHVDHVGWNTRLQDGVWCPTFPNARYLFSREEFEFFSNPANDTERNHTSFMTRADSVDPIVNAGLADPVEVDGTDVLEGFSFHPTPGHTPHHASIVLQSGSEQVLFTGDVMHHPVQVMYPEWNSVFDADPETAVKSRKWALDYARTHDATLFTSHFPLTSAGRVQSGAPRDCWSFL